MKSTSLTVSIPLLCALSTVVYGAPVRRPSLGVRSHVGSQQQADDQQISLQSSDFGSSDRFDSDADGRPSITSEDDDYLSAETPLPSTRLMDMSYEKGQRQGESESASIEQLPVTTYSTPSKSRSHGTFYPPPETWTTFQRKTTATSTREQPLFSSPDPETTPYGFVDTFFPNSFDYDLELDTEALLIWAQTRPLWAWSIIGCLLVGLGVLAVTIVEIAGVVWSALRGGRSMVGCWAVRDWRRE